MAVFLSSYSSFFGDSAPKPPVSPPTAREQGTASGLYLLPHLSVLSLPVSKWGIHKGNPPPVPFVATTFFPNNLTVAYSEGRLVFRRSSIYRYAMKRFRCIGRMIRSDCFIFLPFRLILPSAPTICIALSTNNVSNASR